MTMKKVVLLAEDDDETALSMARLLALHHYVMLAKGATPALRLRPR